MRSVPEHLAAVLALAATGPPVEVPIDAAAGCVLAEDVTAAYALPSFDSSAMDGYAVRAGDLTGADTRHVTLRVLGEAPAGSSVRLRLGAGDAVRIMTGSPMPPGADAVVPVELTDGSATGVVEIRQAPRLGAHVRRCAEDVPRGERVLAAGVVLAPHHLAAAAACGRGRLRVWPRPRVTVLSTGSELVAPGAPLRPGQVADSNATMLAAAVLAAGGDPVHVTGVPDDPAALEEALARCAPGSDLIVTSGGVSTGAYDVVRQSLHGGAMEFVEVAMRPGKPQGLGTWDGTPVLALPGNPVSAFVSFEVFGRPMVRGMRGVAGPSRPPLEAVVTRGWSSPPDRQQYVPVLVEPDDRPGPGGGRDRPGQVSVRATPLPYRGSGSHLVARFAQAQALAVVPPEVTEVVPGDLVRLLDLT